MLVYSCPDNCKYWSTPIYIKFLPYIALNFSTMTLLSINITDDLLFYKKSK